MTYTPKSPSLLLALAATALLGAPALAQTAPAAPAATAPAAQAPASQPDARSAPGDRRAGMMHKSRNAMSPEGRKLLAEAMRPAADAGAQNDKLRAARAKVNQQVVAEKLDVKALRQAMDDERRLVDSQRASRQQTLIDALQKMSVADRKAFADMSRAGHQRMNDMMRKHRPGRDGRASVAPPASPAN